jgi:transcriptional regulator GlxA family with amidase domain
VRAAVRDEALLGWLVRASKIVHRLASVCSGSFILASAGLLDGKCATTHWRACAAFAEMFPRVKVDSNAIFVRDGRMWTSAGVTTGIDMALAMVEEDLGRATADALAAELVLYVRRPGFQAQFSSALVTQSSSSENLRAALSWLRTHLEQASVELLAKRAGLSLRTLHRRCEAEMSTTPAKLIARLRVEQARTLLSTTQLPAKTVATRCGFGSTLRMSRAFHREIGMCPRDYRLLHSV